MPSALDYYLRKEKIAEMFMNIKYETPEVKERALNRLQDSDLSLTQIKELFVEPILNTFKYDLSRPGVC